MKSCKIQVLKLSDQLYQNRLQCRTCRLELLNSNFKFEIWDHEDLLTNFVVNGLLV